MTDLVALPKPRFTSRVTTSTRPWIVGSRQGQGRGKLGAASSCSKRFGVGECGLERLRLSADSRCYRIAKPLIPRPPGSRRRLQDRETCPKRAHRRLRRGSTRSKRGPSSQPIGQTRQQAQSMVRGRGYCPYGCHECGLIPDRTSKPLSFGHLERRLTAQVPLRLAPGKVPVTQFDDLGCDELLNASSLQ